MSKESDIKIGRIAFHEGTRGTYPIHGRDNPPKTRCVVAHAAHLDSSRLLA